MSSSERMLVTGGAGFIGSHLVEALLERGYPVRVVDSLVTGHRSNLEHVEGNYEWIEGDLADFQVCQRAVEGVTCVFHQAAIPSVPRSVKEPLLSHLTGPTATLNLLEAARIAGVRRLLFAASSSAYGETTELPKHEDILPQPLSPYAAGKLAGEAYVSVYARTMGLDGVSLRYFNIFGPRQDPSSPYSGVISIFAKHMAAGRPPVIYGDGCKPATLLILQMWSRQTCWRCCIQSRSKGRSTTSGPAGESVFLNLSPRSTMCLEPRSSPSFGRFVQATSAIPRHVSSALSRSSLTNRSSTLKRGFVGHSNPCD